MLKILTLALLFIATPIQARDDKWNSLHDEHMSAFTQFVDDLGHLGPNKVDCASPAVGLAKDHLEAMKVPLLTYWYVMVGNRSPDYMVQLASHEVDIVAPHFYQSAFYLADLLLASRCLDASDSLYREVLTTFSAPYYAGVQRRAQVGIDDVREARRQISSAPSSTTQSR